MASRHPPKQRSNNDHLPSSSKSTPSVSSATDGDKFLDFVKSLGYDPCPETEKPQHFECYFQDHTPGGTKDTLLELMKKLTPKNVLDPAEVEAFEQLKKDGHVLYGKDLEEAVDRRDAMNKRQSGRNAKLEAKKEALRQEIAGKKREEERLIAIRNSIRYTRNSMPDETVLKTKLERQSRELTIEIEVARRRLEVKMKSIKDAIENDPSKSLTAINMASNAEMWKDLLEREEKLSRNTKRLIEDNIAHLMMQAEALDSNEILQKELGDKLLTILNDNASNLERLKHSIIYEDVRAAEYKWDLAYLEEKSKQIDSCLADYTRMFQKRSGFDMATHWAEMDSVQQQAPTVDAELTAKKEAALSRARNDSRVRVNKELKELVNIQAPAKDRLYNFFSKIYDIVEGQKIRMDLVCNVVAMARRQDIERQNKYRKFSRRADEILKRLDILTKGIPSEDCLNEHGKKLLAHANRQGITDIDLRSFSSSSRALQTVINEGNHRQWEESMKAVDETRDPSLKKMNRDYTQLMDTQSNLYLSEVEKYKKEQEKVTALENQLKQDEDTLKVMEDSKQSLIQESIAQKIASLELMKQIRNEL